MICFACSQCQATLQVKVEMVGKRIRCPHCQHVQAVPLQVPVAADATFPSTPPPTGPREDSLPSQTSPLLRPTVTWNLPDDTHADGAPREVVQAGSAYQLAG